MEFSSSCKILLLAKSVDLYTPSGFRNLDWESGNPSGNKLVDQLQRSWYKLNLFVNWGGARFLVLFKRPTPPPPE